MESSSLKTSLLWALALPFFFLPIPLTVDAPDVHGGYGFHVKIALLLAMFALAGSLLLHSRIPGHIRRALERAKDTAAGRWLQQLHVPTLVSSLLLAATVIGLSRLILHGPLVLAAAMHKRAYSGALSAHQDLGSLVSLELWKDPSTQLHLLTLCCLLYLALRSVEREDSALCLLAVCGLASFAGPAAHLWPLLKQDILLHHSELLYGLAALFAVLALAWRRLPQPSAQLNTQLKRLVVLSATAVGGGLAGLASPWRTVSLDSSVLLLWLLAGALVGAAAGVVLCRAEGGIRKAMGGLARLRLIPLDRRLATAASLVPLAIALVAAAHRSGEILGGLISGGNLFPLPSTLPGGVPAILPILAWLLLCAHLAYRSDKQPNHRNLHGILALAWSILLLSRGLGVAVGGNHGLLLAQLLPTLAVIAIWKTALRSSVEEGCPPPLARAGALSAGALAGIVLALYIGTSGLPWLVGKGPLAIAGLVTGLGLATLWLRSNEQGPGLRQHGDNTHGRLALGRLLWIPALYLPMGLADSFAVSQANTLALLCGGFILFVLLRLAARRDLLSGRLPFPLATSLWLVFYCSHVHVASFKEGPSAHDCSAALDKSNVGILLDRHGIAGDYLEVLPYDVVPLPQAEALLVSHKRISGGGGFVEAIEQERHARLVTEDATGRVLFPERFLYDPQSRLAYVQVLGSLVGADSRLEDGFAPHAMWELQVIETDSGDLDLQHTRTIPLQWEPGNPALDSLNQRLVLSYMPNRGEGNPLLETFDLETLKSRGTVPAANGTLEMADFAWVDAESSLYYVPSLSISSGIPRFEISEIDSATLKARRRLELFHPSVGVVTDASLNRLYATNILGGTVVVYELSSMKVVQVLSSGSFPREVEYDRQRGLLHVANYSSGTVSTFSVDRSSGNLAPLESTNIGSLLRGIGLERGTGRLFAASGCGVFELRTASTGQEG